MSPHDAEPLWIVGASVRAAAESARRAGLEVRAADLFADLDTRRAALTVRLDDYPAGIGALLAAAPPGPWMYTGALENHPALIEAVSATRLLWGNGAKLARRIRDPWQVRDALVDAGVACPRLRHDDEPAAADGVRWLRKPLCSAAGHRVEFVTDDEPQTGADFYLQEFVSGTPCALALLAAGGQARLWMISEQLIGVDWVGARDFWYCGSIGPLAVGPELLAQAERIGDCLAATFGLTGVFGVDCILTAGASPQLLPIEVNPRYTASVELWERVTGQSAIAAHRAACVEGRLEGLEARALPPRTVAGKAIVYARREAALNRAQIEALAAGDVLGADCRVADIPHPADDAPAGRVVLPAGGPMMTLLAEGTSRDGVLRSLQHWVRKLEGWLYA